MSRRIDYYDDIDAPRRVAPQAAIRETKEETGIDCKITGIVGIYSDPKHESSEVS